jgi:phage FluMu gp28-like protein
MDDSVMKSALIEYITRVRLYPYQIRFVRDTSRFRFVVKSRQTGFSWIIANEGVADCITKQHNTTLVVSPSERQSKRLIEYARETLDASSVDYTASKEMIKFNNTRSVMVSLPNNPSTIRGYKADHILVDEFAHFPNSLDLMNSILPAISRGGKLTLNSTPYGQVGMYWEIYDEIQRGVSDYSLHFVPYWECPDLVANIEMIKNNMDEIGFRQEYCCEFVDESVTYFPYELIRKCVDVTLGCVCEV